MRGSNTVAVGTAPDGFQVMDSGPMRVQGLDTGG